MFHTDPFASRVQHPPLYSEPPNVEVKGALKG